MRTEEKLAQICEELTHNMGDMHKAARRCGVSPQFLFQWMKDDPETAARVEEAQRVGYAGLESVAIQRAVHGVEEDVYYKGVVVGTKVNYSDSLLGKLLEARVPAFKKGESGNTFNGPTQINIMPRADNFEQWLEMKNRTLADQAEAKAQKALPKPVPEGEKVPEILQGEYVEVSRPLEQLKDLL